MISSIKIQISFQLSIVSLVSFLVGYHTTYLLHEESASIGGLWAVISAIVVIQATEHKTLRVAWFRILGTFIGAIISVAYLSLLPFSVLGMAGTIFIAVLFWNIILR